MSETAEASPFRSDEQLRATALQRTQADLAGRLGSVHQQHAEATANADVLYAEVVALRTQVLDGLARERDLAAALDARVADVANLRQQLGLPPEAEAEDADPLAGRRSDPNTQRRQDHRLADAYVAPHEREADGQPAALAEAPEGEDLAHAHGAANAASLAEHEARRATEAPGEGALLEEAPE